jgi:small subunit ribosomal protein S16
MQRGGSSHNPHYRVVVTDVRTPRDGRFVERVGTYDPKNKKEAEQINLKLDRIDYWLSVGAKPSDTVRSLIKRARKAAPAEAEVEVAVKAEAPVEAAAVEAEKPASEPASE